MTRAPSEADLNTPWTPPEVDFSILSVPELMAMRDAGSVVVDCHRLLTKSGNNIVAELLRDSQHFYEWHHYPEGDVYDFETHSQYYYHAHPKEERPGEHGHFHTFLRPDGMPQGVLPVPLPDLATPEEPNDALSHLVAISMNSKGFPVRLFTTNRWVTGEVWYAAKDVCRFLPMFEIDLAEPSWVVNRWIGGLLTLFRPQIRALIRQRDAVVADWQRDNPDSNAYEDRALEVTSEMAIDVEAQIATIETALSRR